MPHNKIVFIVGPTAVGKTDVGFFIAQRMGGEIISCDSMLVYRELDIMTSKPPLAMRQEIKHHLIDVVSVSDNFDVARFRTLANEAKADIEGRGKPVIVVGGSGMYMQILLDGIFNEKAGNAELRAELQKRIELEGNAALYSELQKADPAAAGKIHLNDDRRIIRALEVFHSHKRPISDLQKNRQGWWGSEDISLFCLNRPRPELYDRINRRVDEMWEQGLEKEMRALSGKVFSRSANAVIGVKEARDFIDGKHTLETARETMKLNTRHLAKRQMTWFRKDKRLNWVEIGSAESSQEVSRRIMRELK